MNRNLPSTALAFYVSVFKDLTSHSPSLKNANKLSVRYLVKRLRCEGLMFVSSSLPLLGKAVETSIITGEPLQVPRGFALHWRSKLPTFLYQFMVQIFGSDGTPLWKRRTDAEGSSDEAYAFWAIRQVTMAYSKVTDLPAMMTNEDALKAFSVRISSQEEITAPSWVLSRARNLITQVVCEGDRLHPMLAQWDAMPYGRHGPGAVAGKEKGLDKWLFSRIPGANPELYQFRAATEDSRGFIEFGSNAPIRDVESVSRATCVPKDFRGPRIICIEPKELQFAQQGLWSVLQSLIERHPLTRRAINFRHQEYNGRLCTRGDIATIDLKDASDRVMLKLCRILFPKEFFKLVTRYRSREISLNGDRIRPTCFASMGSALCFPIETLVFWAIARASVDPRDSRLPLRVFGDDIIVPRGSAIFVVKMLEACGFKVNVGKTCIDTPVRESCGAFVYRGTDVRITRFKTIGCSSLQEWLSYYENGRALLASHLTQAGLAILKASSIVWPIPYGHNGIPFVQEGIRCQSRWNPELQRSEVLLPVRAMRSGRGKLPAYLGLYAWLVGNQTKPSPYGTEKVKMAWTACLPSR